MMKFEVEITDEAFDLLKKIYISGSAEYRDPEYSNLDDFTNSEKYQSGSHTIRWFEERNFGGTYHLIPELTRYNLVDNNFDAWHLTYELTDLGKDLIGQKEEFLIAEGNEKIKISEEYFLVNQFAKIEKKTLDSIIKKDQGFRYFKSLESAESFIARHTFISHDGEEYFYGIYLESKKIFCIDPDFKGVDTHDGYFPGMNESYIKFFSSKSKAEDFYLMNKPCLSIGEVLPFISDLVDEGDLISMVKEKIKTNA